MPSRRLCIVFVALLVWIGRACPAQSPGHTNFELDFDFRTQFVQGVTAQSRLYSDVIRAKTSLAPGLNVEFYGAHKYKDVLAQQATVEKDWGSQRLQLGIIRLPFGIYDYRETYASGLIDYPMPRVDYSLNSVDWGVPGAQ